MSTSVSVAVADKICQITIGTTKEMEGALVTIDAFCLDCAIGNDDVCEGCVLRDIADNINSLLEEE
jgi:hypothetical protein